MAERVLKVTSEDPRFVPVAMRLGDAMDFLADSTGTNDVCTE